MLGFAVCHVSSQGLTCLTPQRRPESQQGPAGSLRASLFFPDVSLARGWHPETVHVAPRQHSVQTARASGEASGETLKELVQSTNQKHPVVIYSKSWCPYCGRAKGLFKDLGVAYKAIELDQLVEERGVQDVLYDLTGQTTVPNIFIGGQHIGGCDDTMALNSSGKLAQLLADAGVAVAGQS